VVLNTIILTPNLSKECMYMVVLTWHVPFTMIYHFNSSGSMLWAFWHHFASVVPSIVEVTSVNVKYRTAIQALFLYFILCLSIMLDRLSCSFTSISFLTNLLWLLELLLGVALYFYLKTHISTPGYLKIPSIQGYLYKKFNLYQIKSIQKCTLL
jgi:hypothetical protein